MWTDLAKNVMTDGVVLGLLIPVALGWTIAVIKERMNKEVK